MLFKACATGNCFECSGGDALTWCNCPHHADMADYYEDVPPPTDAELEAMRLALERPNAAS